MHSQLHSVKTSHHDRKVASIKLAAYKNELNSGKTQREAAKKLEIARSVVIHVILGLIFHDIWVTKQHKSRNYGI